MKKSKFDVLFRRDFLANFFLIEAACCCLIVFYIFGQTFGFDTGLSTKDAVAALIISFVCIFIYLFYRLLSIFFDR